MIGRISGRTSVYLYDTSVYVNDIQDVHQYTYTYIRTYISKPIRYISIPILISGRTSVYISIPKRYIRTYILISKLISGRTSVYLYLYQDVHQDVHTYIKTYIRTYISIPILISGPHQNTYGFQDVHQDQDVHQYTYTSVQQP